jgi:hypothetical protein
MLEAAELARAMAKLTLGYQRAMDAHKHEPDLYRLCEREQQFQVALTGTTGTLPTETSFSIPFDVHFVPDAGFARDSALTDPTVRIGFVVTTAPAGMIPYAYVQSFTQDSDLFYTGAKILVGVAQPALMLANSDAQVGPFNITLHIAFQGYGAPYDPDGPYPDAGSNT